LDELRVWVENGLVFGYPFVNHLSCLFPYPKLFEMNLSAFDC